jgi:hypothetical protein
MCGAIPPLPQYVFMAWCLVEHSDTFTFTLLSLDNGCHYTWYELSFFIFVIIDNGLDLSCNSLNINVYAKHWGARIAQWYGADLRAGLSWVLVPAGSGNFSLHHRVKKDFGVHPASYPVGTKGPSLGVKRPGREAGHSPQSRCRGQE